MSDPGREAALQGIHDPSTQRWVCLACNDEHPPGPCPFEELASGVASVVATSNEQAPSVATTRGPEHVWTMTSQDGKRCEWSCSVHPGEHKTTFDGRDD